MKVLCFGSLNIDYTYKVEHFVARGETLHSQGLQVFSGGKGLNQSVALARAGAAVYHAGAIGPDGDFLVEELSRAGVNTDHIARLAHVRTGNAIIQNTPDGDNGILLYGGANQAVTAAMADEVLAHFGPGDMLVLQNEISSLASILEQGKARGMTVVLNPSPMNGAILDLPLQSVDYLLLNEVEAAQILAAPVTDGAAAAAALCARLPHTAIVLTMGKAGAYYADSTRQFHCPACAVTAVDTTAAGDTFTGFFLAGILEGMTPCEAMELATRAAAISVTRPGAAPSIPLRAEV